MPSTTSGALGKPRGDGGPWKDTKVKAGTASDPYLMTAYDRKSLTLSADRDVTLTAEIAVAPLVIGSLAQSKGFGTAFLLVAGAFVLAAVLWIWIPETRGRELA